jgi:hypothetical protein
MGKFVKKLLLFAGPFGLLFAGFFLYSNHVIRNNFGQFRFDPQIKKIAVGDSHIMMAVNDRLLDDLKNIAQLSEGFIYSFYKIRALIENNPQIDTIFLGCSFHNFSDYYDDYTYNPYVMGTYFYILPTDVQRVLLMEVGNPVGFLLKSYLSWSPLFLRPAGISDRILGGYSLHPTNVTIDEITIEKRIHEQFFRDKDLRDYSTINIKYLGSIAEYCRQKRISLVILSTPIHRSYREMVPEKFITRFYSIIRDQRLELFQFEGLDLHNEDFHPDGDHLNEAGSRLATEYFKEYVQSGRATATR